MKPSEIREIVVATCQEMIAALVPKPKPQEKPPKRRVRIGWGRLEPERELTETEKVQARFQFLREHGGILAEGRLGESGQVEWRFPQRW